MRRFVLTALPLLLGLMALFGWVSHRLDLVPAPGDLVRLGVLHDLPLPPTAMVGSWVLESLALTALFLLVQGRAGTWWLDGVLAGWIAWIFRGPVLVVTVVTLTRLPRDPWWPLALSWLVLYSVAGVLLAVVARAAAVRR